MQERPHKYEVALSQEQRHALQRLISKGKALASKLAHARILLKIDRNAPVHWLLMISVPKMSVDDSSTHSFFPEG